MTRVAVSGSVLSWALERSDRYSEVEQRFPKLSEWLAGKSQPTMHQLEELAKKTYTPLGYFFLASPPEDKLPIPHFRTLSTGPMPRPSPDLLETVQTMERRQAWMREYLIEQGQEPLAFVRSARLTDRHQQVACDMWRVLGLGQGWAARQSTWTAALRELRERMEGAGILVVVSGIVGNNTRRKLDTDEFRGFVLVDEYAPLVFVNGADWKAAQMFTLAHELAHVWHGSSAAFDLRELQPARDVTEQACNQVAAEFLVPEDELRQIWPSVRQEQEPFEAIARQFKVSTLVAARRAQDLSLITKQKFLDFYKDKRHAAPRQKGGNFYATLNLRIGRRFAEAVVRAAREGKLLYREAYQLTGLYGETFEKYAESFLPGGAP